MGENPNNLQKANDQINTIEQRNHPPFLLFALALIAIPLPMDLSLHIGGHGRANRRVKFSKRGNKIQENSSRSNQVHNYSFKKD